MDEENPVDNALWRASQIVGLLVLLAEVAIVVDMSANGRPREWALGRWRRATASWSRHWSRLTAADRARAEAPFVIYEAWCAMSGERP